MPKPIALALVGVLHVAAATQASDVSETLGGLFKEYNQWYQEQFPEQAMAKGNYANAARITDVSLRATEQRHRDRERFLERLHEIDPAKVVAAARLDYELFELSLSNAVTSHQFRTFLSPIGGRFGTHQRIPQMAERVRFRDQRDYRNYLNRLDQVPGMVDDTITLLKLGLREGRTPPRVTLEGVSEQFDAILDGGLTPLDKPFEIMPARMSAAKRREYAGIYTVQTKPNVEAAVRRLRDYVVNDYLPRTRESISALDLPDGEAFYAHQLRVMTTTDLTARQIHQLGIQEVKRIKEEMLAVIRSSDFMDDRSSTKSLADEVLFAEFVRYLRTDSRFYHTSPEALLTGYRDICKRVDAELPKLFRVLPRLPYGVKAIPEFMAPNQTTAYYSAGNIKNAEPGYFYANTYALDQRPKYEMIALALHEAVPGHHLQIALAHEIEGLPEFRKDAYFTAFGEGWALYAERLGIEMGFYEDPYDNFGRLLYEMWRACRLVVDTGLHALDWPRKRAIKFMMHNTALSELNIENEVDRYIAWPGQACAYKIGELKIRELRAEAEKELGRTFDIREFHDVVLGSGALPLSVLEKKVERWIKSRRIVSYD